MLDKIYIVIIGLIGSVITLAYKLGKSSQKNKNNEKLQNNIDKANKAINSLNDSDVYNDVLQKYTRK